MNDLMDEYFPSDKEIERRAVDRAFGLLAAVGDAKAAKVRLEQITAATAAYSEQRSAAEKIVAEAATKRVAAEAADTDLAKRTEQFQTWTDGTEKSFRAREARILENEQIWSKKNAELEAREVDLARREREHAGLVQRLKELAA